MQTIDLQVDGTKMSDLEAPISVISPQGVRQTSALLDPFLDDIDRDRVVELYTDMVVLRSFDKEAFALTRQGELALWPPLLGQEASQVASVRGLRDNDWIFGSYREHAAPLLRGAEPRQWMKTWKTQSFAGWNPHELRVANCQIIIGAQTLHATGYAMAAKLQGKDDVAMACFGDGATSEGDVNEALVFASTYSAPAIFFCQNNGYAISEPVEVQAKYPLAQRALGFDIPAYRVDGNDVLATLGAVRLAAERGRNGLGPTFIEAVTYRMGPHTTTDDPGRYRSASETERWAERDPLLRVERFLAREGVDVAAVQAEAAERAAAVAHALREEVVSLRPTDSLAMFDHVYTEPTARLAKQRHQHQQLAASIVASGEGSA
jgi:2-oxoisovalerate dehydrogenase E1 component alpha subunit